MTVATRLASAEVLAGTPDIFYLASRKAVGYVSVPARNSTEELWSRQDQAKEGALVTGPLSGRFVSDLVIGSKGILLARGQVMVGEASDVTYLMMINVQGIHTSRQLTRNEWLNILYDLLRA